MIQCSLCIRREHARDGPVMEPSMLFRVSELLVNTAHFANNSRIQIEDNLPSNTEGTRRSAASPAPARGCAMPRRGLAEGLMAGGSKALSQAG
jgi:hypothetical protein